jgi:exosome complex component MTR3
MLTKQDTEPAPLSALLTSHLLPALQLHLLPKSAIDVHLLILESDVLPNVLSAGLTVASAAIADAGIPMFALGVGSTLSRMDGENLVDPENETEEGDATVALGVMPAIGKISGVWLSGEVDIDVACQVSLPVASARAWANNADDRGGHFECQDHPWSIGASFDRGRRGTGGGSSGNGVAQGMACIIYL